MVILCLSFCGYLVLKPNEELFQKFCVVFEKKSKNFPENVNFWLENEYLQFFELFNLLRSIFLFFF